MFIPILYLSMHSSVKDEEVNKAGDDNNLTSVPLWMKIWRIYITISTENEKSSFIV